MIDQPSRQTLDEIPSRVLTFLLGVSKYPTARAALSQRGYTPAEHDHAWSLLTTLGSYPAAPSAGVVDKAVRDAVIEIDAWDEPNFAIIGTALARKHPALVEMIFAGLSPKQGVESVTAVSTLLDRLDKLELDPSAEAKAASSTLADRGYPKAERTRLRDLVSKARAFTAASPVDETAREAILRDLYAWHSDWSTTAKAIIKQRRLLIALGLATPQRRKAEKPAPTGNATSTGSAGQ
ncbi:Hypothetical protein A7982_00633 [Minicystis rosea]|nr:Hypothetical protein A7982_00633 [Minicystis rosea]